MEAYVSDYGRGEETNQSRSSYRIKLRLLKMPYVFAARDPDVHEGVFGVGPAKVDVSEWIERKCVVASATAGYGPLPVSTQLGGRHSPWQKFEGTVLLVAYP